MYKNKYKFVKEGNVSKTPRCWHKPTLLNGCPDYILSIKVPTRKMSGNITWSILKWASIDISEVLPEDRPRETPSGKFLSCFIQFSIWKYRYIALIFHAFVNGPTDLGSIPGRVIPKTQKNGTWYRLAKHTALKSWIKGKVEQSREWSGTLSYTSVS